MGYVEEIYAWDSWKTLGTVLRPERPSVESVGDLDCRELRFDGLYYHHLGGGGDYLRFYPDGEFVSAAVSGDESVRDVARWLRREHKYATIGTFTLKGKSLRGGYHVESPPGEEPILVTLKARLTRQGLKSEHGARVRTRKRKRFTRIMMSNSGKGLPPNNPFHRSRGPRGF